MREEEGARYLSPLVKQDLAKLDTDGDTRRLAVQSLKLFVEQLDASTLPRFISQVCICTNFFFTTESMAEHPNVIIMWGSWCRRTWFWL